MVILQALLTLLTRSAGKLLNTAFGWATVMLFGRVSKERQIYLSIIAFGSVLWIVALISLAAPGFGTFLLTFVTLPKWVDKRLIRLAMAAAVVVIPALVGLVSLLMLEPGARPRRAAAKVATVMRGYPSALVISGRERAATRARAILAERLTVTRAYLTWDKESNEVEDRVREVWQAMRDGRMDEAAATLAAVQHRLRELDVPYDEWEVLFREALLAETALLRGRIPSAARAA